MIVSSSLGRSIRQVKSGWDVTRGELREARSERREARGERREARGERREARSERREARGERREARGEKREARGEFVGKLQKGVRSPWSRVHGPWSGFSPVGRTAAVSRSIFRVRNARIANVRRTTPRATHWFRMFRYRNAWVPTLQALAVRLVAVEYRTTLDTLRSRVRALCNRCGRWVVSRGHLERSAIVCRSKDACRLRSVFLCGYVRLCSV